MGELGYMAETRGLMRATETWVGTTGEEVQPGGRPAVCYGFRIGHLRLPRAMKPRETRFALEG